MINIFRTGYVYDHDTDNPKTTSFIHVMRKFFLELSLFSALLIVTPVLYSQDSLMNQSVSISSGESIYNTLLRISEQTGLYFSYNADLIDASRRVNADIDEQPLIRVLNILIPDTTLNFKRIGNQVVIYREHKVASDTGNFQYSSTFIKVRGEVVDAQTHRPVPYATVGIVGEHTGTITNEDGDFILKLPPERLNDSIWVSSMGYKPVVMYVYKFLQTDHTIRLPTDYIPIEEVIIRNADPLQLIRGARDNIRHNYPVDPAGMTTFYRETVKKFNNFVAVAEAALKIYKASYTGLERDQIKILKGRQVIDASRLDTVSVKIKAGLYTSLLLDIVKNPPEFLNPDFFRAYKYNTSDIVFFNNKSTYVIEFEGITETGDAIYDGTIYIDINSLAIKRAEFKLNRNGIKKASGFLVLSKPRRLRVRPTSARYRIDYSEINNRYYLNYLRSETTFRIRKKRQLFSSQYTIISEMVVTDVNKEDIGRFPFRERARTHDFFSEQLGSYDEDFWEQYNYIKPSESLKKTFQNLSLDE